jgi:hypothetical protein
VKVNCFLLLVVEHLAHSDRQDIGAIFGTLADDGGGSDGV